MEDSAFRSLAKAVAVIEIIALTIIALLAAIL